MNSINRKEYSESVALARHVGTTDPVLDRLEQNEQLFFARVVFGAKIITWTALLILTLIVEFGLVVKVFKSEFTESSYGASQKHRTELAYIIEKIVWIGILADEGRECGAGSIDIHHWERKILDGHSLAEGLAGVVLDPGDDGGNGDGCL